MWPNRLQSRYTRIFAISPWQALISDKPLLTFLIFIWNSSIILAIFYKFTPKIPINSLFSHLGWYVQPLKSISIPISMLSCCREGSLENITSRDVHKHLFPDLMLFSYKTHRLHNIYYRTFSFIQQMAIFKERTFSIFSFISQK